MTEMFSGRAPDALDLLLRRRSASIKAMAEPGPDERELGLILEAGSRVPDHGKLFPWRFLLFDGDARGAFGAVLERVLVARRADVGEGLRRMERGRFLRAPLVIAVISSPKSDKPIPEWEQRLSAGAACQNIVVAATALGFGVQWVTEWYAYDDAVGAALGLADGEQVAGFLYIGTVPAPQDERERPALEAIVDRWLADATGS